jgi:superfamily I DNA/RNA helicase
MKIRTIPQELWVPQDITLEDAALEVITGNVNTLVIAGPGAGKTELLGQRACYLLQTNTCPYPKKILAVSFKKDAASNLSERIQKRCGKELSYRFESMTFDSFAKEILDRFYLSLPVEHRPAKDYIVDTNSRLLEKAFSLAGYQYVRVSPLNPKPKIPPAVMKIMLNGSVERDFQPALTFNLISRLANYLLVNNPLIVKALQAAYSHIFLDEFQDTTDVQYNLVKTCFLSSSRIVTAVGDQKQRIMIWAGAMQDAFERYAQDFSAQEKTLLMNHRSAPTLITMQCSIYNELKSTQLEVVPSDKWQPNDGSVTLHLFSSQTDEAEYIKTHIKHKLDSGTLPREICILTKHSVDEYCQELLGSVDGTAFSIRNESVYQDLLKEDLVKILFAVLLCSQTQNSAEAFVYLQETELLIKSIEIEDETKVNAAIIQLIAFIDAVGIKMQEVSDGSDESKTYFVQITETIIDYYGNKLIRDYFPQYQNGDYFVTVKEQFIELLWTEFCSSPDWLSSLKKFEGETSTPVMTIHKSKGLEYECVFFVGLEDNSFFSFSRQQDEDICAFFVGISRAKKELDITYSEMRNTLRRNSGRQNIQVIQPLYSAINNSGVVAIEDHRLADAHA